MTYAAFFPILLGTVAGVRAVDARLVDAARTMGVPRRRIVTHVIVPAALPALLVALRLGVATSWTAVVAAELIGAPSGLGYAIEWYRGAADDAARDGVHRDDRPSRLPDRQR